jgi:hypothetical protein
MFHVERKISRNSAYYGGSRYGIRCLCPTNTNKAHLQASARGHRKIHNDLCSTWNNYKNAESSSRPGLAQALGVCGPYSFHVEQTFSEVHLSSRTISREADSLRILRRGRAARKLLAIAQGVKNSVSRETRLFQRLIGPQTVSRETDSLGILRCGRGA